MGDEEVSVTPKLIFDEATGYICLSDGAHRQVICRREGDSVYLWWKRDREERRIALEEWRALFS